MNKLLLLINMLILFSVKTFAGNISVTVVDEKNKPLPYASLFVKEISKGTTCNLQPGREIHTRSQAGEIHDCCAVCGLRNSDEEN
jgi:hypothetical protein